MPERTDDDYEDNPYVAPTVEAYVEKAEGTNREPFSPSLFIARDNPGELAVRLIKSNGNEMIIFFEEAGSVILGFLSDRSWNTTRYPDFLTASYYIGIHSVIGETAEICDVTNTRIVVDGEVQVDGTDDVPII